MCSEIPESKYDYRTTGFTAPQWLGENAFGAVPLSTLVAHGLAGAWRLAAVDMTHAPVDNQPLPELITRTPLGPRDASESGGSDLPRRIAQPSLAYPKPLGPVR